ncbi:MAG: histidine kinase [Lewinellaceae bacterium]|nr:histidine kinase [Lewinellaceae bacterium]
MEQTTGNTMYSSPPDIKKGNEKDEHTLLRRLSVNLERWVFTDFEQATAALNELSGLLTPLSPFDIRLSYHRSAAFIENQWHRYDQSLIHARLAIGILESLADNWALAETWADVAATYLNQRDWPAAEDALARAHKYLGEDCPDTLKAHVTCREGFLHLHFGNVLQALDNLMEAEKALMGLDEKASLKDFYIRTLVFSGLGELYEQLGEKEKSLEAYKSVLPIVEKHGLRPRLGWHYLNAGRAALARNDSDQAQAHFEKVLKFAASNEAEVKTHALSNLGIIAMMTGNAVRAFNLFGQAAAHYDPPVKPSDFTNLSKIENWRAGLYHELENQEQAEIHFQNAWEIGQKGNDLYHLGQVGQNLASLHAEKGDFQKAFEWQSKVTDLNQQHFRKLRDHERQEIEARYQLERSRQEAQMAKLRVAGLQLRALRAQMNPHFMFNSLNAIQGLVTSGRNADAESYLAKFAKMMRHTLEYSELEEVTLEQEIEFLKQYLDINRKLRFRDKLNPKIIFPKNQDLDDLLIPTMIVQPFVENAIEHGIRPKQAGNLTISFELLEDDERLLKCVIEDDGVGFNKGREKQAAQMSFQKHRSRGMEITTERLNLLHELQGNEGENFIQIADISDLTNGKNTGTRVIVMLPLLDQE